MKKGNFYNLKFLWILALTGLVTSCTGSGDGVAPSAGGNAAISITPSAITLMATNNYTFTATGGSGSYSYSIPSGSGSILSTTGNYTAPAAAGTDVVRVIDGSGHYADAIVTIVAVLQISPTSQSTTLGGTISFSATGGVAPLTYSVFSGGGSINATSGLYTAPGTIGSAVVRVTDALGNISTANVTYSNALAISPTSYTLAVNNTHTFTASGGTAPYTFSVFSGAGSVNPSSGLYTAPGAAGSAVVRVTDSLGATADANVTINAALQISPTSVTIAVNNTTTFSVSGGVSPYTYSVFSGGGNVNSSSGLYTAPGASGSATVRVTDARGNTSDATVTINPALAISPLTLTLAVNNTGTFSASGGVAPYSYSMVSGGGSVDSSSGLYTAPGSAGSATVRVTDSLGNTSNATVTINAALAISPATKTLAVNNSFTFSASGGVSPYSYSITSGGGSINASSGAYTAPGTAGTATVTVTDSLGNTSNATVTINAALQISPSTVTLGWSSTTTFSTLGGVGPFTYSIQAGIGSVDSSTGLYTSPASNGSATVRVTDSLGNTSDATVTVSSALAISPGTPVYIVTEGSQIFSATGGTPPYTFSRVGGTAADGDFDSEQPSLFVAGSTSGTVTVRVTDNVGGTSNAVITRYLPLTLSPTSVTKAINTTQSFTASGGVGALTFSLVSGVGSIHPTTGLYTAPGTAGSAVIQVADTIGNVLQASITVVSTLTLTPKDIFLPVGSTVNAYQATLGSAPYTFSVDSGGGSIVAGTGVYTASGTWGPGVVRVTDNATNFDTANLTHVKPVELAASWGDHMCALYSGLVYTNYKLKCWGYNNSGQLGLGDTNARGDATAELGYGLPFIDVGTGKYVKEVAAGWFHTCAILNDDTVKCWGNNTYGQLGYGNTTVKGNSSGQMGDNLNTVNLGTGRTAKHIYAFGYRSCAILDNNASKCWGLNDYGQLGQGNTTNYGSGASQMGDSLPAIDFGNGRYAVKLAGGERTTCALLDDGNVKCWGGGVGATCNSTGYCGDLGLETNNKTWGDGPSEMGTNLPTLSLGLTGGQTISDIVAGRQHYCIQISDGTVKCWGRHSNGAIGNNISAAGTQNCIGATAGTMGGNMVAAVGITNVARLASMRESPCIINNSGQATCWGRGTSAQLLRGNATSYGNSAGSMTNVTSSFMNFGTGRTVKRMAGGYNFGCAILDNDRIKCWGTSSGDGNNCTTATKGVLMTGNTTAMCLGDAAGELGDSLPYVNH